MLILSIISIIKSYYMVKATFTRIFKRSTFFLHYTVLQFCIKVRLAKA